MTLQEKALTFLKNGLLFLNDYSHWTQEEFARNKEGDPVPCKDPSATTFCAVGCLYSQLDILDGEAGRFARDTLSRSAVALYKLPVYAVNDGTRDNTLTREEHHQRVLAVYRDAIQNLERGEVKGYE